MPAPLLVLLLKTEQGVLQITVSANVFLQPIFPELKEDMEIIVPIARSTRDNHYDFASHGIYYVTPDGYALAAFDMESSKAKDGMHIKALMEDFQQIKRSPENAERWKSE